MSVMPAGMPSEGAALLHGSGTEAREGLSRSNSAPKCSLPSSIEVSSGGLWDNFFQLTRENIEHIATLLLDDPLKLEPFQKGLVDLEKRTQNRSCTLLVILYSNREARETIAQQLAVEVCAARGNRERIFYTITQSILSSTMLAWESLEGWSREERDHCCLRGVRFLQLIFQSLKRSLGDKAYMRLFGYKDKNTAMLHPDLFVSALFCKKTKDINLIDMTCLKAVLNLNKDADNLRFAEGDRFIIMRPDNERIERIIEMLAEQNFWFLELIIQKLKLRDGGEEGVLRLLPAILRNTTNLSEAFSDAFPVGSDMSHVLFSNIVRFTLNFAGEDERASIFKHLAGFVTQYNSNQFWEILLDLSYGKKCVEAVRSIRDNLPQGSDMHRECCEAWLSWAQEEKSCTIL